MATPTRQGALVGYMVVQDIQFSLKISVTMEDQDTRKLNDSPTKDEIAAALKNANATNVCPRCGNLGFAVVDSVALPTYASYSVNIGKTIPAAAVVCTKCGFLSLHAYGLLGLPMRGPKKEDEK